MDSVTKDEDVAAILTEAVLWRLCSFGVDNAVLALVSHRGMSGVASSDPHVHHHSCVASKS